MNEENVDDSEAKMIEQNRSLILELKEKQFQMNKCPEEKSLHNVEYQPSEPYKNNMKFCATKPQVNTQRRSKI